MLLAGLVTRTTIGELAIHAGFQILAPRLLAANGNPRTSATNNKGFGLAGHRELGIPPTKNNLCPAHAPKGQNLVA